MGDRSKVEWTEASWTPIRARWFEPQNDGSGKERVGWHCEHVSEGCRNCYAEGMNLRLGTGLHFKPDHGKRPTKFPGDARGDVTVFLDETMLLQPLRWRRPRKIFVGSMTDIFAHFVEDAWLDQMFAVIALCPQHTFQVLTKRPERMHAYCSDPSTPQRIYEAVCDLAVSLSLNVILIAPGINEKLAPPGPRLLLGTWPLPNVWLGTSCEDQPAVNTRIPQLLATPAAIRFVSAEPLLGLIDFRGIWSHCPTHDFHSGFCIGACPDRRRLGWIIVGGESGPHARPMHLDWARRIRDQCAAAGVPFYFKQWGEWLPFLPWGSVEGGGAPRGRKDWLILGRDGGLDIPDDRVPDEDAGEWAVLKAGKGRAGRLLDGIEYNGMPEVRA